MSKRTVLPQQITLRETGLRAGTVRFFHKRGMETLGDVTLHNERELREKGVVNRLLEYLRRLLGRYGLFLRGEQPPPEKKQDRSPPTHAPETSVVRASADIPLEHTSIAKDKIPFFHQLGFRVLGDFTAYTVHELIEKGIVKQTLAKVRRVLRTYQLSLQVVKTDLHMLSLKAAGFSQQITDFYAMHGIVTLGDLATHGADSRHASYVQTKLIKYGLTTHINTREDEEEDSTHEDLQLRYPDVMPDGTRSVAQFIEKNKRLAYAFVRRHRFLAIAQKQDPSITVEDLDQEALIGMLIALSKFDPHKGKFSTYAWWWMHQRVKRFIENSGTIRIPPHLRHLARRYLNKESELYEETSETPTKHEVLSALDMGVGKGESLLSVVNIHRFKIISLHTAIRGNKNEKLNHLQDVIGDETLGTGRHLTTHAQTLENKSVVEHLLNSVGLKPTEREIIERRFGLNGYPDETLTEIGAALGVTKENVRQREARALEKIRHHVEMLKDRNAK
jgi:RNA polymerase sigma factor (sigma-70 family)